MSTELRIPESTAEVVLERLASDNFLDVKISNAILYRFNPATAALEASAALCAEFYLRERIAMINLVMAAALGPLHDFAEAFRIKQGARMPETVYLLCAATSVTCAVCCFAPIAGCGRACCCGAACASCCSPSTTQCYSISGRRRVALRPHLGIEVMRP